MTSPLDELHDRLRDAVGEGALIPLLLLCDHDDLLEIRDLMLANSAEPLREHPEFLADSGRPVGYLDALVESIRRLVPARPPQSPYAALLVAAARSAGGRPGETLDAFEGRLAETGAAPSGDAPEPAAIARVAAILAAARRKAARHLHGPAPQWAGQLVQPARTESGAIDRLAERTGALFQQGLSAMGRAVREVAGEDDADEDPLFGDLPACRIAVAGRSGSGKTVLVRTLLGDDLAVDESIEPSTPTAQWRRPPTGRALVELLDTRGLEAGDRPFAESLTMLHEAIEKARGSAEAELQLDLAWLCIDHERGRLEAPEQELFHFLNDRLRVPTVIVLTRAWGASDFAESVRALLPEAPAVVPVLAQDYRSRSGRVVGAFGLDRLVEESARLLPRGKQEAFYARQRAEFRPRAEAARRLLPWYVGKAAAIATVPIPFADAVPLVALQSLMIVQLSRRLGYEGSRDMLVPLASAALAGTAGTFAGRLAAANLARIVKVVPAVGTVLGAGINSTVAGQITKIIGDAYIGFVSDFYGNRGRLPTAAEVGEFFRGRWR